MLPDQNIAFFIFADGLAWIYIKAKKYGVSLPNISLSLFNKVVLFCTTSEEKTDEDSFLWRSVIIIQGIPKIEPPWDRIN